MKYNYYDSMEIRISEALNTTKYDVVTHVKGIMEETYCGLTEALYEVFDTDVSIESDGDTKLHVLENLELLFKATRYMKEDDSAVANILAGLNNRWDDLDHDIRIYVGRRLIEHYVESRDSRIMKFLNI